MCKCRYCKIEAREKDCLCCREVDAMPIALAKILRCEESILPSCLFWETARLLVTRVSLIYLLDEFFLLFLVYPKKMRTMSESKVLSLFLVLIRWNKEGRYVQDFLLLPQGFESFPSDLRRARWCNLVCVACLYMIKPMVVSFCSIGG